MGFRRFVRRLRPTRIDYVCPECARAFDLPLDACPVCKCPQLHRIVK